LESKNMMMKRKLSVVLVAAALDLYVASIAQAACPANPADGATPFSTGPLNPVNGYAEYVSDSRGTSLQICLDPNNCVFDPVVEGNLQSQQAGAGSESFYWLSGARLDVPATGFSARLVMAAEAAYTSEVPAPDEQLSFTRLRIRIDAPVPGHYKVTHPYGENTFTVNEVVPGLEVSDTIDISFTPNQASAQGRVGPWLRWDADAPAGYIGDGATPHRVIGSPCGNNFFSVTANDFNGRPINLTGNPGLGNNTVVTDLFTVSGQLYDGKTQTPLSADRITYSRAALTPAGQIDAFASSANAAAVTIEDGPGTAAGSARLTTPRTLASNNAGKFFTSERLADASTLPGAITIRSSVANGVTDATALVRPLTDQVVITQADYNVATGTLVVAATSSDARTAPALTLQEYSTAAGQPVRTLAPPAVVTVMSAAGGWDQAQVRTVGAVAPGAPSNLSGIVNSATEVALSWSDNSSNETAFEVERNGVVIATLAANTSAYTDSAAPHNSTLTYRVFANNAAGRMGSNTISVTTPLGLNAPTNLAATAVTATNVAMSWVDNSNNETSFQVLRNGAVLATLAPNVTSYTDTTVAASTAYTYQVLATANGATAGSNALAVTTPAAVVLQAPGNLTVLRPANDDAVVRLDWTDTSTGETAYRVQRATYAVAANGTVTRGAFATTTTPTGDLGANSTSYTNSGIALNTLYAFQVNAANGATQGPVSTVNRYSGTLPLPTNFRSTVTNGGLLGFGATPVRRVPLNWTASGAAAVAGYEVEMCVGSTATCGAAGATWTQVARTAGRATNTVNVNNLTSRQVYSFRIRSHTGTIGLTSTWSALVAGTPR
jgi:hypothetical protein